ncbi:MAG TPA: hypothetical protein VF771_07520 [Longimicrobiaceae bacterium]
MSANDALRTLLDALLDVHRKAYDLREHETAYHALAAAAHAADSLADEDALERIARLSRDELAWIDAHTPEHRLSTESAKKRNHQSIFEQLGMTAMGMRQRLQAERVRQELQRRVDELTAG